MARVDMITLAVSSGEEYLGQFKFSPEEMRKIVTRVINRTLLAARTEFVKETTGHYAVPAKAVRETIAVANASKKMLYGRIRMKGKGAIPLLEWGAKQKKKGVSVRILKSGPRKTIKGAFINKVGGRDYVLIREGKARYPIRKLYGPGLISHISKKEVTWQMQRRAEEMFRKRLEHEAAYMLARKAKS